MTISAQALNYEIIDDLKAILGDGFADIIREQVEQSSVYMQEIRQLLDANDAKGAMRQAHALKSSVGQIGLQGMHALAKELEFTCNADSEKGEVSTHARQLYNLIGDELPGAIKALVVYVKQ